MKSRIRTRVIKCPVQNRLVEVSYTKIGSWFKYDYNIHSCPAMRDGGGCDRQCKHLLSIPTQTADWGARQ